MDAQTAKVRTDTILSCLDVFVSNKFVAANTDDTEIMKNALNEAFDAKKKLRSLIHEILVEV